MFLVATDWGSRLVKPYILAQSIASQIPKLEFLNLWRRWLLRGSCERAKKYDSASAFMTDEEEMELPQRQVFVWILKVVNVLLRMLRPFS
jgi:hypothetical protein